MLTKGLEDAKREASAKGGGDDGGMGSLGGVFGQPDVLAKIAGNPQTASFLADPGFVAKIDEVTNRGSSRRGSYEYGTYQSYC